MRSKLEVCPPRQPNAELRRNFVCLGTPNYKPGESSKKGRMVARLLAAGASDENESCEVGNSITPSLLFHFIFHFSFTSPIPTIFDDVRNFL
jgi:hypothetical protein